jgi:cell division protein FtsW (lipid II flippase)
MPKPIRDNGLTLVLLLLFLVSLAGHSVVGRAKYNEDQEEHGRPTVTYAGYVTSSAFIESVFENWESEFLQMALYVWLTSFLYQRGSAESKDPDEREEVDEEPETHQSDPEAPSPVRLGGVVLKLYENSLSLALLFLFLISFVLHLRGSVGESCRESLMHGGTCSTMIEHLGSSSFWFESFQNWQSEFLSIAVVVVFSIFLRQKGSPESKPVHTPHAKTGK